MANHQDRIDQLNQKLETLIGKQENFAQELMGLYKEIEALKKLPVDQLFIENDTKAPIVEPVIEIGQTDEPKIAAPELKSATENKPKEMVVVEQQPIKTSSQIPKPPLKSNLEKFIGENLINKIGIAITVIGVAIGAKYSIENNLISPLTRIILGYLVGIGLIGFGIKLKLKYENFSAVLVSGALAIMYLITFAAYSFYALFPQLMAFALMLLFTIFGVVAALNYNKVVIAHIGLVGAYAVPFLLSDDSGSTLVFFSYIAIINIGIVFIALQRYWKSLYYAAFVFTWLIYSSWQIFNFVQETDFTLAAIFLSVFFLIFYTTFLAYKLVKSEKFVKSDIVLLFLNSFLFYGLGYGLLNDHELGKELLGVFTLLNAVVHFAVSAFIYRKKLADRNLFYLVSGLVLVFITLAIPVQLDGNWVTLLWALEAALLFWIGRTKHVPFYERLAYPLMIFGFFSLLQDWDSSYQSYFPERHFASIVNIAFLSSLLFVAALGLINWINYRTSQERKTHWLSNIMNFIMPTIFLLALFGSFYVEIDYYFEKAFQNSETRVAGEAAYPDYNYHLSDFGKVWLSNYTLFFLSAMAFANVQIIKNRIFGIITLVLHLLYAFFFLTAALYLLSELRVAYLDQNSDGNFEIGPFYVGIRYIAFVFFGILMFSMYTLTRAPFMRIDVKLPYEMLVHTAILWILSSELLNWMDIAGSTQTYKLGLSILWGVYSLLLIGLGIWKTKKQLRIAGIALFAVTLIKLFFYDIASLDTISKTIVFVSLGVLLLVISFLYNKYKPAKDENES
ncbi:MAG: DUF2339 domain-containing protein [Flavobacteriaceae bacterium]